MVVVGVDEDWGDAGGVGAGAVGGGGVADVDGAAGVEAAEAFERDLENAWIGFRHPDD